MRALLSDALHSNAAPMRHCWACMHAFQCPEGWACLSVGLSCPHPQTKSLRAQPAVRCSSKTLTSVGAVHTGLWRQAPGVPPSWSYCIKTPSQRPWLRTDGAAGGWGRGVKSPCASCCCSAVPGWTRATAELGRLSRPKYQPRNFGCFWRVCSVSPWGSPMSATQSWQHKVNPAAASAVKNNQQPDHQK